MAGPRKVSEVLRQLLDELTPADRASAQRMLNELAGTISPGLLPRLFRALAHEIALADAVEAADFAEREAELRRSDD